MLILHVQGQHSHHPAGCLDPIGQPLRRRDGGGPHPSPLRGGARGSPQCYHERPGQDPPRPDESQQLEYISLKAAAAAVVIKKPR